MGMKMNNLSHQKFTNCGRYTRSGSSLVVVYNINTEVEVVLVEVRSTFEEVYSNPQVAVVVYGIHFRMVV